jgi:hypothetical protein
MFADLLLALTVVFLATISFVPVQAQGQASISPLASFAISKNSIALSVLDVKTLEEAITAYATANHFSNNTLVSNMTITGGYSPQTQSESFGTEAALKFATMISSLKLPYFKGTATQLGSSPTIISGHVVLSLNLNGL